MKKIVFAVLLAAFSGSVANAANMLQNSGFETPNFNGSYSYIGCNAQICIPNDPSYGWTFSNSHAGIAANNSAFGVMGAKGNQAGFLQVSNSSISQNFDFLGSEFSVSFLAEGRNYGGGGNPLSVSVGAKQLTFGGSASFTPDISGFSAYTSDPISLAPGNYALTFTGLGVPNNDVTSFIDEVSINASGNGAPTAAVPEPTSVALLGLGLLGFIASRRKVAHK